MSGSNRMNFRAWDAYLEYVIKGRPDSKDKNKSQAYCPKTREGAYQVEREIKNGISEICAGDD